MDKEMQLPIPGIYSHYKNKLYCVRGIAVGHDDDKSEVIYHSIDDESAWFRRPAAEWFDIMENGLQRFTLVQRGRRCIGYMDKVDYQEELCNVPDGNKVYGTLTDLEREETCSIQCGIVKVNIDLLEVINPGRFG